MHLQRQIYRSSRSGYLDSIVDEEIVAAELEWHAGSHLNHLDKYICNAFKGIYIYNLGIAHTLTLPSSPELTTTSSSSCRLSRSCLLAQQTWLISYSSCAAST